MAGGHDKQNLSPSDRLSNFKDSVLEGVFGRGVRFLAVEVGFFGLRIRCNFLKNLTSKEEEVRKFKKWDSTGFPQPSAEKGFYYPGGFGKASRVRFPQLRT